MARILDRVVKNVSDLISNLSLFCSFNFVLKCKYSKICAIHPFKFLNIDIISNNALSFKKNVDTKIACFVKVMRATLYSIDSFYF